MIWKQQHISTEARGAKNHIEEYICEANAFIGKEHIDEKRIGIVGGGPKGLYALERLLNNINESRNKTPIQIIWFNQTSDFGSGNNYQVSQPDNLLINYCIGNIDAWLRDEVNNTVNEQLSLTDWIKKHNITDVDVAPTDFASRALVGCYLQDVLKQILSSIPNETTLNLIVEEVKAIKYENHFLVGFANTAITMELDYVLMTTGHCYQNTPPFIGEITDKYFPSAYPVHHLDAIPARASVGVLGLGLTWVDICLQLTEGRGGVFDDNGKYQASGKEPMIYPFSRSNLPIQPRDAIFGTRRYQLRKTTVDDLLTLLDERSDRQIDFQHEVYPIIEKEIQFAYYSTLLQTKNESIITAYQQSIPEAELFTFQKLLFPEIDTSDADRHVNTINYIADIVERAEVGELNDPYMAAAAVWREATPLIGRIYNFGGLTPASQEYLDQKIWSACCRTSFGPPIANMRKMLALAEAGIIQFSIAPQSSVQFDQSKDEFIVGTSSTRKTLSYLIDGRIARSKPGQTNTSLYRNLGDEQLVTAYRNGNYELGCIDISQDGKAKINGSEIDIPLYFYGTPTEGILFDNDSLSRVRNNLASPWADAMLQLINPTTHGLYAYND